MPRGWAQVNKRTGPIRSSMITASERTGVRRGGNWQPEGGSVSLGSLRRVSKEAGEETMDGRKWYALGAVAGIAAAAGILAGSCTGSASAPVIDPDPVEWIRQEWEPETVSFTMVSEAHIGPLAVVTAGAVPAARQLVPAEWDESDVELLARLLWSSPLRNEDAKRQLVWVVLNRVDDERTIFARTIAGNVNRKEFTFFDRKAYLSETNLRVAREELERWTRVLSGIEERPVPEGYVYLRFAGDGNRMIYLMKEIGGEAL